LQAQGAGLEASVQFINGLRLDHSTGTFRKMTPADFVELFRRWVIEYYELCREDAHKAKNEALKFYSGAAKAWNKQLSTSNSEELKWFCGAALDIVENEAKVAEIEPLYRIACSNGKMLFNFADKEVANWWPVFLDYGGVAESRRADWEECEYSIEDLQQAQLANASGQATSGGVA
jgi:hypothetical protein